MTLYIHLYIYIYTCVCIYIYIYNVYIIYLLYLILLYISTTPFKHQNTFLFHINCTLHVGNDIQWWCIKLFPDPTSGPETDRSQWCHPHCHSKPHQSLLYWCETETRLLHWSLRHLPLNAVPADHQVGDSLGPDGPQRHCTRGICKSYIYVCYVKETLTGLLVLSSLGWWHI